MCFLDFNVHSWDNSNLYWRYYNLLQKWVLTRHPGGSIGKAWSSGIGLGEISLSEFKWVGSLIQSDWWSQIFYSFFFLLSVGFDFTQKVSWSSFYLLCHLCWYWSFTYISTFTGVFIFVCFQWGYKHACRDLSKSTASCMWVPRLDILLGPVLYLESFTTTIYSHHRTE